MTIVERLRECWGPDFISGDRIEVILQEVNVKFISEAECTALCEALPINHSLGLLKKWLFVHYEGKMGGAYAYYSERHPEFLERARRELVQIGNYYESEAAKPKTSMKQAGYTYVCCAKCFVDVDLGSPVELLPYCGRCYDVGDKVIASEVEYTVVKLYTLHSGKYGTMTRVKDSSGGIYEYFNERVRKI